MESPTAPTIQSPILMSVSTAPRVHASTSTASGSIMVFMPSSHSESVSIGPMMHCGQYSSTGTTSAPMPTSGSTTKLSVAEKMASALKSVPPSRLIANTPSMTRPPIIITITAKTGSMALTERGGTPGLTLARSLLTPSSCFASSASSTLPASARRRPWLRARRSLTSIGPQSRRMRTFEHTNASIITG